MNVYEVKYEPGSGYIILKKFKNKIVGRTGPYQDKGEAVMKANTLNRQEKEKHQPENPSQELSQADAINMLQDLRRWIT